MGKIKAGAARVDITPPVGVALSGYIRRSGRSKGVHDPLGAHFLLVEDGNTKVFLASLDVLFLDEEFVSRVRTAVSRILGLSEKDILIGAVHTHSAPGIHTFRNCGERDEKWETKLFEACVEGAEKARSGLRPASVGTGTAKAFIGKNRRKESAGIDPILSLAVFFDEREQVFAIIANHACHPVVLDENNFLISSDYVGYFRRYMGKMLSSDVTILYFCGADGDVDPVERGSFAAAEKLGRLLAQKSSPMIENMDRRDSFEIKTISEMMRIPYGRIPEKKEIETLCDEYRAQHDTALNRGDHDEAKILKAFLLWAQEVRGQIQNGSLPLDHSYELQCIRLGPAVLLASPFELFSAIARSLRIKSGLKGLFVVGYANGYGGYLPDEGAFDEGGYEVEEAYKYTGLMPLSPIAESLFLERGLFLLDRVKVPTSS